MAKLFMGAERVSPSGSVSSTGVINQLGRPSLDMLSVLAREAVQNSWDAREPNGKGPVEFGVRGWKLTPRQIKVLRDLVFVDSPPLESLNLRAVFKQAELFGLLIYDRGTLGLGGPTRADAPSGADETRDFVDFLRNVGQPPDKALSGGTYGYGKASFYRASKVQTILVHSRCRYKGRQQSRFIAAALGSPYESKRSERFTGRYWWGREDDKIAEPLTGALADTLAENLGFPAFDPAECGTSILILQPKLALDGDGDVPDAALTNRTAKQALSLIAENLLWNFWPKMIRYNGKPPAMRFTVKFENETIKIPDPEQYPPLAGFVEAMRLVKGAKSGSGPFRSATAEIVSLRPAQNLGRHALQLFPASAERAFDTGSDAGDSAGPFTRLTHHTALMRQPELVVKYLPGPMPAQGQLAYAGVFVASSDTDGAFADSEPPTHDEWVPQYLDDKRHKSYVKVALNRIRDAMEMFAKPAAGEQQAGELAPLGAFAGRLGDSLMPSIPGAAPLLPIGPKQKDVTKPGPGTEHSVAAGAGGDETETGNLLPPPLPPRLIKDESKGGEYNRPIRKAHARVEVTFSRPFVSNGVRRLEIGFTVKHAAGSAGSSIKAKPYALLDGMEAEAEPPAGALRPEILRWIDSNGTRYAGIGEVFIKADETKEWRVIVSMPDDVYLNVDLSGEAEFTA